MLDSEMQAQLEQVFSRLEQGVCLTLEAPETLTPEGDQDLSTVKEMIEGLIRCSPRLSTQTKASTGKIARLGVSPQGADPRVFFRGTPGGHEFSSLILAILHADSKGKLPDEGILQRIQALKGHQTVRTYVSLSCENCPEVVQALNLIAFQNPALTHEVVDGALAQEEATALGLQGVPAVYIDGKLVHSGKASLFELLSTLEAELGTDEAAVSKRELGDYEVAVLGGGPAGASAAIYSARKGLKTVLIAERMGGQLKDTQGIENMISIPYTEGTQLAAQLSEHLSRYPVQILEHRRVRVIQDGEGSPFKVIELEQGEILRARTIIVATGAKWKELGIPGEREHIGRGVAFCAHCDGPFYAGKRVVVVGGGNSGVEAALDLSAIASHVTLLEFSAKLKADEVLISKLQSQANVQILTQSQSQRVIGESGKVVGLEFKNRESGALTTLPVDGVFVQIGLQPNSQFLRGIVDLTSYGEVIVDAKGRTSKPGIYAAGDVTTIPFKQIVTALGDGAKVALAAFEDRMHDRESV